MHHGGTQLPDYKHKSKNLPFATTLILIEEDCSFHQYGLLSILNCIFLIDSMSIASLVPRSAGLDSRETILFKYSPQTTTTINSIYLSAAQVINRHHHSPVLMMSGRMLSSTLTAVVMGYTPVDYIHIKTQLQVNIPHGHSTGASTTTCTLKMMRKCGSPSR